MPEYPLPPGVSERRLTVRTCGLEIPAALTRSADRPCASALLLIPGSLFSDVNGDFPAWNSFPGAYVSLAHQLAQRGHAVYRYAKAGPGTGTAVVDESLWARHRNWDGRVTIALAAFDAMRAALAEERISAPILISGHSEGAVVVSRLASRVSAVRGVILLSGPSVGILSIMREQSARTAPSDQRDTALAAMDRAIACIRRGEPIPDELKQAWGVGGLTQMPPDGLQYMADCDATDPCTEIAAVREPVLVVQGGRDSSVSSEHAHRLVAARGSLPTQCLFVPELNHFYKDVPTDVPPMEAFGFPGPCDPRVADGVDAWLRTVT